MNSLVVLSRFMNAGEAYMVKGMLEGEGIEFASVSDEKK